MADPMGTESGVKHKGDQIDDSTSVVLVGGETKEGKVATVTMVGEDSESLKVSGEYTELLREILTELKAIKLHLYVLTEMEIDGTE